MRRDKAGVFQEVAKVNLNLKAHAKQVSCVAFSADSRRAATASKDGTWAVWNLDVRYHLNEDAKKLLQARQVRKQVATHVCQICKRGTAPTNASGHTSCNSHIGN